MNKYFPKTKNMNKLKITDEGLYSVSKPKVSEEIINYILLKTDKKNITILDATGNVGGDSITFGLSNKVKKVITTELNPENFKCLMNNIKVYKLEKKIEIYNVDFIKFYKILKKKVDVIYIDPPWGGPDYKKKSKINLFLSNISIGKIVNDIIKQKVTDNIFIKIPFNFNITKFLFETGLKNLDLYSISNSSVYIIYLS